MAGRRDVETARLIARLAHKGQTDKQGVPYILHPEAVAGRLSTNEEKVLGWLHDVVEDTDVTAEEIRAVFGDEIADRLELLTRDKSILYMEYIRNLAADPVTRRVKLADLSHNMDLSRCLTDETLAMAKERNARKYGPAVAFLETCGKVRLYREEGTGMVHVAHAEMRDGILTLSLVDAGSEAQSFQGDEDYESWYIFDEDNTKKLMDLLRGTGEDEDTARGLTLLQNRITGSEQLQRMLADCEEKGIESLFSCRT